MDPILDSPSLFTIPPHIPFLKGLAGGLIKMTKDDPLKLATLTLYLPYQRAVSSLKQMLLEETKGQTTFLPQLACLGEWDGERPDNPTTGPRLIPPLRRHALLTTLIRQHQVARAHKEELPSLAAVSRLARELMSLMDQVSIEGVTLQNLESLVPENLSHHWQTTLDFLKIVTQYWPDILQEKGYQDPYNAHREAVSQTLDFWEKSPPNQWIIAAGSTGTMPCTAALLQAIAHLPQGSVILPGLDTTLSASIAENLSVTHPQYASTRLLAKMSIAPSQVQPWPHLPPHSHPAGSARSSWYQQAFHPELASPTIDPQALDNLTLIPCASPQQEATVVALILRQSLERTSEKAVLISADRELNQRVSSEMMRWGLSLYDSSGTPLTQTPTGAFLRLLWSVVVEDYVPIPLLTLLKHPFLGLDPELIWKLEKEVLRGIRLAPGLPSIQQAIDDPLVQGILDHLEASLQPLAQLVQEPAQEEKIPLTHLLQAHRQAALTMVPSIWSATTDGAACHKLLSNLADYATAYPPLSSADYGPFLEESLQNTVLPPTAHGHPRLAILGPLEARLLRTDTAILAGLNEGTWPPTCPADPWLSRPMREQLGLPAPERRIGLSSHDFGQAFCSSERVFLTRSTRAQGSPTVPSRILLRLEAALKTSGHQLPTDHQWIDWAEQIDTPEQIQIPLRPAPCPPVSARPRKLSVTQIELWKRDPYALYAKHILKLFPLESLEADPDHAQLGTHIHSIFDAFLKQCQDIHHPHSWNQLLSLGEQAFQPLQQRPAIHIFWWSRFQKSAAWFLETERSRRKNSHSYRSVTEVPGSWTWEAPYGPFQLTARADRIDYFKHNHTVDIIDYKTGTLPIESDITLGFSPQLPLEAVIAQQGGFQSLPPTTVNALSFWHLKGQASSIKTLSKTPVCENTRSALAGVQEMVALFDDPQTPYHAQPLPEKGLQYNDYIHLARNIA